MSVNKLNASEEIIFKKASKKQTEKYLTHVQNMNETRRVEAAEKAKKHFELEKEASRKTRGTLVRFLIVIAISLTLYTIGFMNIFSSPDTFAIGAIIVFVGFLYTNIYTKITREENKEVIAIAKDLSEKTPHFLK